MKNEEKTGERVQCTAYCKRGGGVKVRLEGREKR